MVTGYRLDSEGGTSFGPADLSRRGDGVLWLDAVNPDEGELAALDGMAGMEIPNRRDMAEIELSNRLYIDGGALVMIGSLLPASALRSSAPRPATFILKDDMLLTVRYCEFPSFDRVAAAVPKSGERRTPLGVFFLLMEAAVADRADGLEFLMRSLEEVASRLFPSGPGGRASKRDPESSALAETLREIGSMGALASNIRESIASLQRILNFARSHIPAARLGDDSGVLDSLRNDLTALSDEASFFMNKLMFNLDTTLGMINIEETKVIRVLSVVTLIFTPPVLIAGVYGMNFVNMPELGWSFGYLFAISLILGSIGLSIWYLKRRKWF